VAWPERELPGGASQGRLRASDADRDGVIDALKSAFVLGFVTKDEFDARVSQTLAARTHADLVVVTSDLPARLAAAQPAQGRAPLNARATVRPTDGAILASALLAAVAYSAAIASDDGWLAFVAFASALATVVMVAIQARTARRLQPPGGHRPGQGKIDAGVGSTLDPRHALPSARGYLPPNRSTTCHTPGVSGLTS
jgi:hypothetical protein